MASAVNANGIEPAAATAPEPTPPSPTAPATWQSPNRIAYDFRSDTVTTPTASMLSALSTTSLGDDVFHDSLSTNALESRIASLTGKPAALLVTSGTMANQVALRTHLLAPPYSILADSRAHTIAHEAGGAASLSSALLIPVRPANTHYLTLEDVRAHAVLDSDIHHCPTRIICLENTIAGVPVPLLECHRIATWVRDHNAAAAAAAASTSDPADPEARAYNPPLKLHLDGARLWECVASGAGSLADYCANFDSVSLCFSKGLGAPMGSVVVGTPAFIERARHIRKMLGGGGRQMGIVAACADVAVTEVFQGGKLEKTHAVAEKIGGMWERGGGRLELPVRTNMVWLDLGNAAVDAERFVEVAGEEGVKVLGGRIVVHHQICEDAVVRLERAMGRVLAEATENGEGTTGGDGAAKGARLPGTTSYTL